MKLLSEEEEQSWTLLALASLLDETKLLFRPSLECLMEKTALVSYPSLSGPSEEF